MIQSRLPCFLFLSTGLTQSRPSSLLSHDSLWGNLPSIGGHRGTLPPASVVSSGTFPLEPMLHMVSWVQGHHGHGATRTPTHRARGTFPRGTTHAHTCLGSNGVVGAIGNGGSDVDTPSDSESRVARVASALAYPACALSSWHSRTSIRLR